MKFFRDKKEQLIDIAMISIGVIFFTFIIAQIFGDSYEYRAKYNEYKAERTRHDR